MADGKRAIALLVHGSKDQSWLLPFCELAQKVAEASGARVEIACLQFCLPTLAETLAKLAGGGATEVLVVPAFISSRGHVLKDVPKVVDEARRRFPGLRIEVAEALGEQAEVREAMLKSLVRLAGAGD